MFDLTVLSVDALSPGQGFLYLNQQEADLAGVVAGRASRVVVALDHTKFNTTAPFCGPMPAQVTTLISDRAPEGAMAQALQSWGVDAQVVREAQYEV